MEYRQYDPQRDEEAAIRIWREIGWLEKDKTEILPVYINAGRAIVADIHGEAECLVLTADGTIKYQNNDLTMCCVTGVTTSRVGRKQGLACRLAARAIATDAERGALVAGLGMFEQGYYNQIGFGTGSYELYISFDPAQLTIPTKPRPPFRIGPDNWEEMHIARLSRRRPHGSCNLLPSAISKADHKWSDNSFGLGYRDGDGNSLSHFFWCSTEDVSHGPYRVSYMVYQTRDQFLELMGLLRNLGDQVNLISMNEPAGIQIQDLLKQPFRHRQITERSKYESRMHASAYWQIRMNDLPACLARTKLDTEPVRFNLHISDPIERYLAETQRWRGVGGSYIVEFGPNSFAKFGFDPELPTLKATVNAFSRMWLGVRPATGLAITDELTGPPELIAALDNALRLPQPKQDWDF